MKNLERHPVLLNCGETLAKIDKDKCRDLYVAGQVLLQVLAGKDPYLAKSNIEYQLAMRDNCKGSK